MLLAFLSLGIHQAKVCSAMFLHVFLEGQHFTIGISLFSHPLKLLMLSNHEIQFWTHPLFEYWTFKGLHSPPISSQLFECSLSSSLAVVVMQVNKACHPSIFISSDAISPTPPLGASNAKLSLSCSLPLLLLEATLKYGSPWKSRSREASAVKHQALLSKKRIKKPWTKKAHLLF